MKPVIRNELAEFWRAKELERGRIIPVQQVAKAKGLNWETVNNLKTGHTTRYDGEVIAKICEYFGVQEGEPIPFLVYGSVAEQ